MDSHILGLMMPGLRECLVLLIVGACGVVAVGLPVLCIVYVAMTRRKTQRRVGQLKDEVQSLRQRLGEDGNPSR